MNKLKASGQDSSRSLVLSFDRKWEELLCECRVKMVFRKKGPARRDVDYLYIYMGLPAAAIIGRAKIIVYGRLALRDAIQHASEGCISASDLKQYAASELELGAFKIGDFEPATNRLTNSFLKARFGFTPPQRFFFLSNDGKLLLDEAAGFAVT